MRLAVLIGVFVFVLLVENGSTHVEGWRALAPIIFLVSAAFVVVICAIDQKLTSLLQAAHPWQRPSLAISPFARHKPLQSWLFGGLLICSAGFALLIRGLTSEPSALSTGIILLAGGLGLQAGVRASLWIFRKRFAERATALR